VREYLEVDDRGQDAQNDEGDEECDKRAYRDASAEVEVGVVVTKSHECSTLTMPHEYQDPKDPSTTYLNLTPAIAPISAKELPHAEAEISAPGGNGPDRVAGEHRVRERTNRDRDAAGCRSR
jgi:hypothetical protein